MSEYKSFANRNKREINKENGKILNKLDLFFFIIIIK